jgi:hypothetical protein
MSYENLGAHLALKQGNAATKGRLGNIQDLSRPSEAAQFGDPQKET